MREQIAELTSALRNYIGKVAAHADPEVEGSEALAAALLVPLVQWKDAPLHSNREDEEETSPEFDLTVPLPLARINPRNHPRS